MPELLLDSQAGAGKQRGHRFRVVEPLRASESHGLVPTGAGERGAVGNDVPVNRLDLEPLAHRGAVRAHELPHDVRRPALPISDQRITRVEYEPAVLGES